MIGRPRNSTFVVAAIFVATFALYLFVRPDPTPAIEFVPARAGDDRSSRQHDTAGYGRVVDVVVTGRIFDKCSIDDLVFGHPSVEHLWIGHVAVEHFSVDHPTVRRDQRHLEHSDGNVDRCGQHSARQQLDVYPLTLESPSES
ncbi:MAG TPA: hypothetical protein VM282_12390 [Acidimicrobiales bacterium]|nr:hypothetical protein [Acidimicrobiales bacterium]